LDSPEASDGQSISTVRRLKLLNLQELKKYCGVTILAYFILQWNTLNPAPASTNFSSVAVSAHGKMTKRRWIVEP